MKTLELKQVAAWCGGKMDPKYGKITVQGVTTDSREIKAGDLFIPLSGARTDGHNFISRAMEDGAAAVLTEHEPRLGIPSVRVDNTLEAFGRLAARYRGSLGVKVLAITGSVGKTTTKEMLAAILHRRFHTTWTEGNHNNNLGLPISVMEIEPDTEYAVLELGMNHFGEMSYLTKIAKPDVAIFTNIGTMHIEYLGSREGILKAKMEILEGMSGKGTVIMNGDEPLLWNLRGRLKQRLFYFGIENEACDVRACELSSSGGGERFTAAGFGRTVPIFVPSAGRHSVYNALAAATAAMLCGAEDKDIRDGLSDFQNTGRRQQIYVKKGFTIIDDCYNAGPESMAAALDVLAAQKCEGRRIAVLGDMLELGPVSSAEHYRIGRLAAEKGIDAVVAFGANSGRVVLGAITGGVAASRALGYEDQDQLVQELRARSHPGDVLLFKGSRGSRMERVLDRFLADDEE